MPQIIRTHVHDNYNILKEFSESNSGLLYKGQPIGASVAGTVSAHEVKVIYGVSGIHGIRYYNNRLQYLYNNNYWRDVSTNADTIPVSTKANNALIKYTDGYYVPSVPINNATTEHVNAAKNEIKNEVNNNLQKQEQVFNEKYNTIITKLSEISANTTKTSVHEFAGESLELDEIIDISSLYNLSSDVILNMELMIKNISDENVLEFKILENSIETLSVTLKSLEVQKYKLPNMPNIQMYANGNYEIYLYVNYI